MSDKTTVVNAVEVERFDGVGIKIPNKMTIPTAIGVLSRVHQAEDAMIELKDIINCFPYDGSLALGKALKMLHGFVLSKDKVPEFKSVSTSVTGSTRVPWGTFEIPGVPDASVTCGIARLESTEIGFAMSATCHGRDKGIIEALFAKTREIALSESIYRGKSINFAQGPVGRDGLRALPIITFKAVSETPAIFSRPVEDLIDACIKTPIRHMEAAKRVGIPIKQGVLLAGPFGNGKTLACCNIAREGMAHGWTFIEITQIEDASDIQAALMFAKRYAPAIILIEDIDRYVGLERTDEVNAIINTVSGTSTKDMDVIMLFTSNFPTKINEAMLRAERIDVKIEIPMPDSEAVERIIRQYGVGTIDMATNLSPVGLALAGESPATIRAVIERSKLKAIRRTDGESALVIADDLLFTTDEVLKETKLFPKPEQDAHPLELMGRGIGSRISSHLLHIAEDVVERHTNGHSND